MTFLNDAVLDAGLAYLVSNGDRVDICNAEPANYTEATSTFSLGFEASLSVGSPANGDVSGRKVTVPALTAVEVLTTDTATHFALSKTSATAALLAAQALASSQGVTDGNTFTLPAWDIELRDPT